MKKSRNSQEILNDFLSRIIKQDNGHWIWIGCDFPSGYGAFYIDGKTITAHRASMHLLKDFDLSSGLQVNHIIECDIKRCVNPDHLYVGTHKDNMRDILAAGNNHEKNKTHCPQGHKYTKENTYYFRGWRRCNECHRIREARFSSKAKRLALANDKKP